MVDALIEEIDAREREEAAKGTTAASSNGRIRLPILT